MSNPTDLKIAEMLHQGKKYREIAKSLHVGSDTIKKVRDLVSAGIILIDENEKAFLAKPAKKEIEEIHAQVMEVVTKKATELALRNAEEDYALGNEIRQYWSLKAKEVDMEIRDYVRSALIFYADYRDEVENMKEQVEVARIIMDAYKRDVVRARKLELYYKFVRYCLYLKTQGIKITQEVVDTFWQDLTLLEKREELKTVPTEGI